MCCKNVPYVAVSQATSDTWPPQGCALHVPYTVCMHRVDRPCAVILSYASLHDTAMNLICVITLPVRLVSYPTMQHHYTALMKAAEGGHAACVDIIIKASADVNAKDSVSTRHL